MGKEQHPDGKTSDRSIETQTDLCLLHVRMVSRDTQTEGTEQEPASDNQPTAIFTPDDNDMEDKDLDKIQQLEDNNNTKSGPCIGESGEVIQPVARNCRSTSFTLEKGNGAKPSDMLLFKEIPRDSQGAKGCDTNSKSHCITNSTVTTAVRYETSLNSPKEKPFQCKECAICFKKHSNLISHIQIHYGVKRFECKECGRLFKRSDGLARHGRTHTGEKPFKCKQCGRCFGDSYSLARHVRTIH